MIVANSLHRSNLAIPGNDLSIVSDALGSDPDGVLLDLEDSLAPGEKVNARERIPSLVTEHNWEDIVLSYRINGVRTRWWYGDVITVISEVGDEIDVLIIPKVRKNEDVQAVSLLLDSIERNAGIEPGSIKISAQIETAEGMNNVKAIAQASDRLDALIFGPADYATSVGALHGARDYPGHYWHYPLARLSHAAASAGLHAIGGAYVDSGDEEAFQEACFLERSLGYDGKIVVNPAQVEMAHEVFSPDADEIERAQRIVRRYEDAPQNTVAAIDGNVIDPAMYRMAKRIISKAERADLI